MKGNERKPLLQQVDSDRSMATMTSKDLEQQEKPQSTFVGKVVKSIKNKFLGNAKS